METIADLLDRARQYDEELPPAPPRPEIPEGKDIAAWIDYTLLRPDATVAQVRNLCQEAREYGFASVCINPAYVSLASGLLASSHVMVCTVVGFPLGASLSEQKAFETLSCINRGAVEIDMVINIGALKSEAYGQVLNDIQMISQIAHNQRGLVKVIIETALLTRREKIIACLLSKVAGADYVKTSTGFGPGGATVEDVDLMYRVVGPDVKVKATGGIRSLPAAKAMIQAGATRVGTSAGVQIVKEAES